MMPKVIPHMCRHIFYSSMDKSRMNPKILQYIMGHADISVAMSTCAHANFDDARDELWRVGVVCAAAK